MKISRSYNSLSSEEVSKLWIPYVVFENTENTEGTKVAEDTEITITREGTYSESTIDALHEINVFSGKDNRITFHQMFTKVFECEYQLQLYPFDTQV